MAFMGKLEVLLHRVRFSCSFTSSEKTVFLSVKHKANLEGLCLRQKGSKSEGLKGGEDHSHLLAEQPCASRLPISKLGMISLYCENQMRSYMNTLAQDAIL